jgi:4-hydroxy-tetrahydrodipicolinate synthase
VTRDLVAERLSGIIPPVCTPLTSDGEVDATSLARHLGYLLEAGVHGVFMLGSTSEVAFLTDLQRERVLEVAVVSVGGQVPVLAGAIDLTTARVVEQALRAKRAGVDGIVLTAPFYAQLGHPTELKAHFRTVQNRVDLPLVAYDIPVAVHTKLDAPVLLELAAEGTIAAVKDSSQDFASLRRLVAASREQKILSILTGSELLVDCAMFFGAAGAVPGLANVDPRSYVALHHACRCGDWDEARRIQDRLVRLWNIVTVANPLNKGTSSSIIGGYKTALMLRGLFANDQVGVPQVRLDQAETSAVRAILDEQGLL